MTQTQCSEHSTPALPRWQRGFTLVELMVVVALVGILGTLATPMFRTLIEANRVTTRLREFQSDLQFARSEAIKQGLPVSICPSSDKTRCLGGNNWQVGWIVIPGPDSAGAFASGASPLRVRPVWSGADILAAAPAVSMVTYNRDGFAATPASGDVRFKLQAASLDTAATRCLVINRAGQLEEEASGTGGCT